MPRVRCLVITWNERFYLNMACISMMRIFSLRFMDYSKTRFTASALMRLPDRFSLSEFKNCRVGVHVYGSILKLMFIINLKITCMPYESTHIDLLATIISLFFCHTTFNF